MLSSDEPGRGWMVALLCPLGIFMGYDMNGTTMASLKKSGPATTTVTRLSFAAGAHMPKMGTSSAGAYRQVGALGWKWSPPSPCTRQAEAYGCHLVLPGFA